MEEMSLKEFENRYSYPCSTRYEPEAQNVCKVYLKLLKSRRGGFLNEIGSK